MAQFTLENRNMDFDGVSEGVQKSGMESYMEFLKFEVLDKVIEKLEEIDMIQSAIDDGWQGKSRDAFLTKLGNQINQTEESIRREFYDLNNKLSQLYQSYHTEDQNMLAE